MEIFIIVLLIFLILILGVSVFFMYKKLSDVTQNSSGNDRVVQLLSDSLSAKMMDIDRKMETVKDHVSNRLGENIQFIQSSTNEVNTRLTTASKVIGELQTRIVAFEEGSKRIYDIGKDLSELQNILRAPKLRGGFGEWLLEELLMQILPRESFETQKKYKSGDIVDAIVKLKDGYFLPIDAKFPLENFRKLVELEDDLAKDGLKRDLRKDIRKHIDAISSKYISKEEGSLDIALMYIPAENIYYETVIREDDILNIRAYAFSKNVVPVSPNTLYAYMQTIVLGMKGMQVSKKAREILDTIKTMESEFANVVDSYSVVGKHLVNAQTKYQETDKYLARFGNKLQGAITLSDTTAIEE